MHDLYAISVRQTRDLPVVSLFPHPASFRFHLTMDTLAFGYILPAVGQIRDLHPLETCAAGRTTKTAAGHTPAAVSFAALHPKRLPVAGFLRRKGNLFIPELSE